MLSGRKDSNVEEMINILSENVPLKDLEIASAKMNKKESNVHAMLNSFAFKKEDFRHMQVVYE